ncbi:hypothetical protein LguiA_005802 [Lonicera macranthoides]
MAGRGSLASLLPFADANAVVAKMANEVLPTKRVRIRPALAFTPTWIFLKGLVSSLRIKWSSWKCRNNIHYLLEVIV